MKIERQDKINTTQFQNIDWGDFFEYMEELYLKIGMSGDAGNAHKVGDGTVHTFVSDVKVHPVTTLTYSLD